VSDDTRHNVEGSSAREAEDAALFEFAEEAHVPPSAWSRAKFVTALNWFAAENDDAPVLIVDSVQHRRRLTPWIALAAGLALCIAVGGAIVLMPTRPPARISDSLPAQTIPFVPTAPPLVIAEARPSLPLLTVDRTAAAIPANVETTRASAPAPAIAAVPRPVEPPAAPPVPLPVPPSPNVPVSPPRVAESAPPPARTEEVARAAEPAAVTAASTIDHDEREIRSLLDAYRDSYDRRDVVSTARLWPGVDTAALSRAFGTIAKQQIDFEQCAFDVIGHRATARCSGSLQYVRRVGNSSPQSRSLSWDFELDRSTGQWLISRVTAQ
jgi:hypothetical protein